MTSKDLRRAADVLRAAKRLTVLTGAGISAESGVPTFRGKDGLWNQFRAEELATPEAFARDPRLVWEWYDWRRGKIASVEPNAGHRTLAKWQETESSFTLITQNVDGLHAKAGSMTVLELHGNIWKTRCTAEATVSENREVPLTRIPPLCPACGALLRPHIVWFGESLDPDVLDAAFAASAACDAMLVVGTSALVQPAAMLPVRAAAAGALVIEVNPDPTPLSPSVEVSLRGPAGVVLPLIDRLLERS
jgi:NAD-dependent deacetylase